MQGWRVGMSHRPGLDFPVTAAQWTKTGLCCTLACHTEPDGHSTRNTRDEGRAEVGAGDGDEAGDPALPGCARRVPEAPAMSSE